MARGSVRFVWPAPGLPVFLQGDGRFSAIIAQEGSDTEDLHNWGKQLALCGVDEETSIPLEVEAIKSCDPENDLPLINGYTALSESRRSSFTRIVLKASQPLLPTPPRRVKLYDILNAGRIERPRSVAVFAPSRGMLNLAFAADLHLAAAWDAIADAVDRHAPDLAAGMFHPGRLLEKFIDKMNVMVAKGELDLVIFGGDLVDHVYANSQNGTAGTLDDSNLKILLGSISRLQAPTITIPGNHDYRLYPWRPRAYGLQSVGIPASRTKKLLQRAGLWSSLPIRLADLHALRTEERCGRSALTHYLTHITPATDFSLLLNGVRLIFVSTGRDAISQWRGTEFVRSGLLMRSLRHSWLHPDSEGLTDTQISKIASWLQMPGGAAFFSHAPLLNATHTEKVGHCVGHINACSKNNLSSQISFERRLKRAGMRNGVCFRNTEPLLRALAAHPGPVTTFSGHVHQASAIHFDRTSLSLQTAELAPPIDPGQTVTLLTAPALGHAPVGNHHLPGYLFAQFQDGALVRLDQQSI